MTEDILDELIEQIDKACKEALIKGIETNSVILNEEFDFCKGFTTPRNLSEITKVPPMILGKHIFTSKLPSGYSFALTKTTYTDELEYYKARCAELEEKLERIKEELE